VARSSGQTFQKRQKEKLRQQRMQDKAAARLEAKERKLSGAVPRLEGEDPDIAGIRPGPQPLPEQWQYGAEEEADAEEEGAQ